jgi:hypothetical protein
VTPSRRSWKGWPSPTESARVALLEWGREIEREGVAYLASYCFASGFATLLPYVVGEDVGLVTIASGGHLLVWRTVFDRRAPKSVADVEAIIAPVPLSQGKVVKSISPSLLASLATAYREAAA